MMKAYLFRFDHDVDGLNKLFGEGWRLLNTVSTDFGILFLLQKGP